MSDDKRSDRIDPNAGSGMLMSGIVWTRTRKPVPRRTVIMTAEEADWLRGITWPGPDSEPGTWRDRPPLL